MAHLVNCFECGAEVSSEAGECPKCGNSVLGYYCLICDKRSKRSELVSSFSHPECIAKVDEEYNSFRYTCILCQTVQKVEEYSQDRCKKCGHHIADQFKKESCWNCTRALVPACAIKVYEEKSSSRAKYVHRHCYNSSPKKFRRYLSKIRQFCAWLLLL